MTTNEMLARLKAMKVCDGPPWYPHRLLRVLRDGVFWKIEDLITGDWRYFARPQDTVSAILRVTAEMSDR